MWRVQSTRVLGRRRGRALVAAHWTARSAMAADSDDWPKLPAVKIYKVFAGRTGDAYLTRPTEELAKFDKYFADLEKKLGDVQFVGGDMVPPAEVDEVAAKLKDADALLDHPSLGPRRRRAGAGQAHRCRLADGPLLAALQRPRLDVLSAVAQAGQEGRAPAHAATGASSSRVVGLMRVPGLAEADAHPRRRRAARHRRRLLGRAESRRSSAPTW